MYVQNIFMSGNTSQYKDLLQLMIEASGEEGEVEEEKETAVPAECPAHRATKKKGVMTDAEVVANSVGFLIAGNETTSTALSCASYLLALNPGIQEKLQSEIDAYFEDKPVRHAYTIQYSVNIQQHYYVSIAGLYPLYSSSRDHLS